MKKKVLIIDDSRDLTETLEYLLKSEGYKAMSAHNYKEGVTKALHKSPDLILLDVFLPKPDGYSICEELKNSVNTKDIKIIIMSGQAREEGAVLAELSKANKYIYKPFDNDSLCNDIRLSLIHI